MRCAFCVFCGHSTAFSRIIARYRAVSLYGHGIGSERRGAEWVILGYAGDAWQRSATLHLLQSCLREFKEGRDGQMLSNTWGDRNRDARIREAFIADEIKAGAKLGVDICQIDDGWQEGITANSAYAKNGARWNGGYYRTNPKFWTPRLERFPQGLNGSAALAAQNKMSLGLWFSPDAENDYALWEKDAATVLGFYKDWGVRNVKIDGMRVSNDLGQQNLRRFVEKVIVESKGEVGFDVDITAEVRPGYFGLVGAGRLFLENRYSDFHSWWPHATLRNLWQLSWYIPPQRFRIEFLNHTRSLDMYKGDPLAPSEYPDDYACATTLVANPLAWFEVSNLPERLSASMSKLIAVWKTQREELHRGTILPIGMCPTGASWTGFCSVNPNAAQVLVFRERTQTAGTTLDLPLPAGTWSVERLAGQGTATYEAGRLKVTIPAQLNYLWVRLQKP